MDFGKRPLGPERRADQEPDTLPSPSAERNVQQQTPAPQQTVVKEKPRHKHGRAFSFVSILLLFALLALGVMTYLWYDETQKIASLESQISQQEAEIVNKDDGGESGAPIDELNAEEQAVLAAGDYICASYEMNCEKIVQQATVVQITDITLQEGLQETGFAIIEYTEGAETRTLWLKTASGLTGWTVIFEGTTLPGEIVEKFSVPETFSYETE